MIFHSIIGIMKEAIEFVKKLKIQTYTEWKLYVSCCYNNVTYYNTKKEPCEKLPKHIPPNIKTYLDNCINEAKPRKYVKKDGTPVKSKKKYKITSKNLFKPEPIIDLDDYLPYEQAKEFIKQFNITCYSDWLQLVMNARIPNNTAPFKPSNIPDNPHIVYLIDDSWFHWGHFLSIKEREVNLKKYHIHKDKYLSYEEAREWARTLKLSGYYDWKLYTDCPKARDYYNKAGDVCAKKPIEIPVKVKTHYMQTGEWVSWSDFLGYEEKVKIPLAKLQKIAKQNNISTINGWHAFARQNDYPIQLQSVYYADWVSWTTFLGKTRFSYLSYQDAKNFLNNKSFPTLKAYEKWWDQEKPEFLPRDLSTYRLYCKDNDIPYNVKDFLSSGIVEKFNNMVDISVVYISSYRDEYIKNLISVSVDKKGLVNAALVAKKKNQNVIAIFDLKDNLPLLKRIIKQHCVKYTQGESNQYLVTNYHSFMNDMKTEFDEVVMPAIIY